MTRSESNETPSPTELEHLASRVAARDHEPAQAYLVVGSLLERRGRLESAEARRRLDYCSVDAYDPDFLPIDLSGD